MVQLGGKRVNPLNYPYHNRLLFKNTHPFVGIFIPKKLQLFINRR